MGRAKEKEAPQKRKGPLSIFQCDQCSKTYKHRTSLNIHMKKVHIEKGPHMSSEISKQKKTLDKTSVKIDIPDTRHVQEMTTSRKPPKLPSLSNVIDKIQMKPIENTGKSDSAPEEEEQDIFRKEILETEEEEVNVERENNKEEDAETQSIWTSPSPALKNQSEKRRTSLSTPGVPLKKPRRLPDGTPIKEGYGRKEETRRVRPEEVHPSQRAVKSKGE